jgi:hypothetical protein
MRARVAICAGMVLGLWLGTSAVAGAGAAPGGFTFSVPPGWLDVSRGAPEPQRQKAPRALIAQADNPNMAFVAFEPDSEGDGFVENMNAVVQTGKRAPLPTAEGLAELERGLAAQFGLQGMTYLSQRLEVVKVAGVTSGRMVGEVKGPLGHVANVIYLIPGEMAFATLTFTTTPDKLGRYQPIFEAAAQGTRGAVEPPSASQRLGAQIGAVVGGCAGAVVAVWATRRRRKRRDAAIAAAGSPPAAGPLPL